MEDRLRVRSADDPENPEALVIERFERLKLKNDHQPSGWVVIAWHPNRAALVESMERLKAGAQEHIGRADALLAQAGATRAEVPEPTIADVVRALDRRVAKAIFGTMPPTTPEAVAEQLTKFLMPAWESVLARFGKGLEP